MQQVEVSPCGAVVQYYRVECNHGNKYFTDEDMAIAYFDYMDACGYDVELWLVRKFYDRCGKLIKAEQQLMEAETDESFVSYN